MGVGGFGIPSTNVVSVFWKLLQPNLGDLIERLDLKLSWLIVPNISVGFPFAAAMLDLNVCEASDGKGDGTLVKSF